MKKVVVTGLGAVTPIGNDIKSFWEALVAGKSGIDQITRFDTADFKAHVAGEVKDFDPLQYMDKGEARKADLFEKYAIGAACQAIEDSGLNEENIESSRLGVYVGSGIGGMETFVNNTIALHENGPRKVSPFFVPMMISNMASGLIAIKFKAQGPCLPVVSACATGTHAVGEAYRCIERGDADAVIAGGAEAAITPLALAGFGNAMALNGSEDPTCASIPFDARRKGFVMGEGAGVLILEEKEHALARGAHIYAELVGYGNTCDGYHITSPDPEGTMGAAAIRRAMQDAGVVSSENTVASGIDLRNVYINAHGTSTVLNDKCETAEIKQVLGQDAYQVRISSTKSMTGHMLGAAGAVEAIAIALSLENGIVPPTIGYKEPDPECDLDYTPNKAVHAPLEYAFSTSLGFGGHNACIAMKKYGKG